MSPPAKILAVDDRPTNLAALERILDPLGYQVVNATSGKEALSRLLEHDIALILMDVQMPGLSGFETIEIIKQQRQTQHIPVIFVTERSLEQADLQRGVALGSTDYLLKPLDDRSLRETITALFRREQARERQEQEIADRSFARFADHLPQPLFAARADGSFYFFNAAFRAYAGRASLSLLHPQDSGRFGVAWREALESGAGFVVEARLRRTDGAHRRHLVHVTPERDERQRLQRWTAVAVDIEDERAAAQVRDAFVSTISHELRAPLNAIVGWTSLLQSGSLDRERARQAVDTVARNAAAQRRIIEDLLDVSHILAGSLRLDARPVRLAEVLRRSAAAVAQACAERDLALDVQTGDESEVTGDRKRLEQAIGHLLSNAIKFTPEGGRIEVRLERIGSRLELSVRDSGIGIGREFLASAFDPFRQEDAITLRRHGGLGLGLAIVRHLVEMHHGTVRAQSEGHGKGATFTVRLPVRVVQAEAREATGEIRLDGTASLQGLSVLVVDDEEDARELLSALLGAHGACVRAVGSVREALAAVRAAPPDLLVSDIGMPDEDGFTLVRKLRALDSGRGGNVPAVALSGFTGAEDRRRGYKAGFQEYLTKPVQPELLVSRLAALAARRT